MPGELAGAQVVGNLLALPMWFEQERRRKWEEQQVFGPPALDPATGQPQPFDPNFLGIKNPIGRGLLQGIGTVGQILQAVTGAGNPAPRPPTLTEMTSAREMQRKMEAQRRYQDALARGDKAEATKWLAIFAPATAMKEAFPAAVGSGPQTMNAWIMELEQLEAGPQTPETAARMGVLKDAINRSQALGVARQQAGIAAMTAAMGPRAAARADVATREKLGAVARTGELLEAEGLGQPPPPSAPEAPIGPGGAAAPGGTAAPSAFQPVAYNSIDELVTNEARLRGMIYTGGRWNLESGHIDFGAPGRPTKEGALAASLGIRNPQAMSVDEAGRFLIALRRYDEAVFAAHEETKRLGATVPAETQAYLRDLTTLRTLAARTVSDFTPEERARYVGILRRPWLKIQQFFRADSRFAEWVALSGALEQAKFVWGGKQLTPYEGRVVEQVVPTGREVGGVVEYDAKVKLFASWVQERMRVTASLATIKIGDLPGWVESQLAEQDLRFLQALGVDPKAPAPPKRPPGVPMNAIFTPGVGWVEP
jgi:hypothetical protein